LSRISPSVLRDEVVRVAEQTDATFGRTPSAAAGPRDPLTLPTGLAYLTDPTYLAYPAYPAYLTHPTYFAVIRKCPRRFCDQHPSFSSLQNGCSLPLLMTTMRAVGTPRLTR
jgi:hypothetical protein